MRGHCELARHDISRVFRSLMGIEHVTIEDRDAVLLALEGFDRALDFADALHLARSARASRFLTFDQRLVRRVKGLATGAPVVLLK